MKQTRQFIAIDLKSFYASVEAVERGLDPLDVNLVVADESRTDKTICLAVSPSLKAMGVGSRPRLFEAKEAIRLSSPGFCWPVPLAYCSGLRSAISVSEETSGKTGLRKSQAT